MIKVLTTTILYFSVMWREIVRKALMNAALDDLEVKSDDILNAYIQAPVQEKV